MSGTFKLRKNKMRENIVQIREKYQGFWGIKTKTSIKDSYSLSLAYTPGVGRSCIEIKDNINASFELTNRANSIAVITDSSNFSDFANINPLCAIPAVETKSALYKEFAGIDAYPIVVNTKEISKIADIIINLAPNFAGVDLDDFLQERTSNLASRLDSHIKLPVFYSYRKTNLFFTLEDADLLDKFDSNLILPAIFRAALDVRATEINDEMLDIIAPTLEEAKKSGLISDCNNFLNFKVAAKIASSVAKAALDSGAATLPVTPEFVENKYLDFLYEGEKSWFDKPINGYLSQNHSIEENSLEFHRVTHGVIETTTKANLKNINDYNMYYSSDNVKQITKEIEQNYLRAYDLTPKGNLVAVISDGSAVLGFGNIGSEAAIPVMEGKAALFKTLAGVDAVPICLKTQDPDKIIDIISHITPVFGGINLEDISAPRCFNIEKKLVDTLNIPVFHDDQHGTAIIVLAGFLNALKLVDKKIEDLKVVINGAGAAALSVAKILLGSGLKNLILCDLAGAIYSGRKEEMDAFKEDISHKTNPNKEKGSLKDIIRGADFFIGLSAANVLKPDMIKTMVTKPVIFALANPTPEIMPDIAYEAGAYIVATGRSDFKNQVNNSLAFPGIFRGALDVRAKKINDTMKIAAANAIADLIKDSELNEDYIIPHALDLRVPPKVASAVAKSAVETGIAQKIIDSDIIHERTKNYLYEGFFRLKV